MKLRNLLILAAIAIVGTASIFAWRANSPPDEKSDVAIGKSTKSPSNSLSVSGVKVVASPFEEKIVANGTLRAEESIELRAEISGKVTSLNFQEGQLVNQGNLLVKIDDSTEQANLRRAASRRDLARVREQRLANLIGDGGVSQLSVDEARGEVAVIEAELDAIRADIAKTEIRAPFDGVVGIRSISIGAYVNPNTSIATLQGISQLKIDFSVPERYAPQVAIGDTVSFFVSGDPITHTAKVFAKEPRIDISTRSIRIRAIAQNSNNSLLPGNFARVEYTLQKDAESILVPSIALISGLDERFLFLEQEGVAFRTLVTVGARTASQVQILEGVKPGNVVLTTGIQQLRQGSQVSVTLEP